MFFVGGRDSKVWPSPLPPSSSSRAAHLAAIAAHPCHDTDGLTSCAAAAVATAAAHNRAAHELGRRRHTSPPGGRTLLCVTLAPATAQSTAWRPPSLAWPCQTVGRPRHPLITCRRSWRRASRRRRWRRGCLSRGRRRQRLYRWRAVPPHPAAVREVLHEHVPKAPLCADMFRGATAASNSGSLRCTPEVNFICIATCVSPWNGAHNATQSLHHRGMYRCEGAPPAPWP